MKKFAIFMLLVVGFGAAFMLSDCSNTEEIFNQLKDQFQEKFDKNAPEGEDF